MLCYIFDIDHAIVILEEHKNRLDRIILKYQEEISHHWF